MVPEYIISTVDQGSPRIVPFSELYAQRRDITAMTLLWDHNSYHVNVVDRYFIINGGRKLHFEDLFPVPMILYSRRNRFEVSDGEGAKDPMVTYLLGLQSQDEKKQLFLHISGDGQAWAWDNAR